VTSFIVGRLMSAVPVLLVVSLVVFGLIHVSPGDPAAIIAGDLATPEEVRRIREKLGLDEPFLVQYARWLGRIAAGHDVRQEPGPEAGLGHRVDL